MDASLEPTQGVPVTGYLLGQELQSEEAAKPDIFWLLGDTYACAVGFLQDLPMRKSLADLGHAAFRLEVESSGGFAQIGSAPPPAAED